MLQAFQKISMLSHTRILFSILKTINQRITLFLLRKYN